MWQSRLACSVILAAMALFGKETLADEEPGGAAFAQGRVRRDEAAFRALYTVNRDGTNAQYLVAAPGMISSGTPAWSHDGKMVAFDALADVDDVCRSQLFVYAVEGPFKGPVRALGYGNTPSWSPDDRRIAFMINDENPLSVRGGVWLMDADGGNRRWLAQGWYPRWSPDGKRLCCHAWLPNGAASLFVIDADHGCEPAAIPGRRLGIARARGQLVSGWKADYLRRRPRRQRPSGHDRCQRRRGLDPGALQ